MFGSCFVILHFVPFYFCNHLDGKKSAGCFILTVFLMSCDCQCSVDLPNGAVRWSAECECGSS